MVKNMPDNAGDKRDPTQGLIPELERFPGGGHGNPLQYSCLENSMDRGAWRARVRRVFTYKAGGQGPVFGKGIYKFGKLLLSGKLAEKEKISGLLKAEYILLILGGQYILYVIASVIKLSVVGNDLSVLDLGSADLGDLGKSNQNSLTALITQTSFNVVLFI